MSKKIKVIVEVPPELVTSIIKASKKLMISRSGVVRQSIKKYCDEVNREQTC